MFKFLKRLSFFVIPAAFVYVVLPLIVLYHTGENFYKIDSLLASKQKFRIGYRFNESNINYTKWKSLQILPAHDVIALGSSRVLEFRENMFNTSFYNAGFTISKITDFRIFLNSLPKEKYPKYLIVGLDQWMFNSNWDNFSSTAAPNKWKTSYHFYPNRASFNNFGTEFLDGKVNILRHSEMQNGRFHVGYNAVAENSGFINDGSIFYGNPIQLLIDGDRKFYDEAFERIDHGNKRFEYGNTANPNAFEELEAFADFCKQNNIYLIAFFPPFADKVLQKMETSGNYHYIDSLYEKSLPILKARGFECYDFTNLRNAKSSDDEMIDGFHGGEVTYAKMLIHMLERNSQLNKVADKIKLEKDLSEKISNYQVYPF